MRLGPKREAQPLYVCDGAALLHQPRGDQFQDRAAGRSESGPAIWRPG